jgi:hypothetical protein
VTAAVNNADVDDLLGLDGYEQGVLAVCGVGRPTGERSAFDPEFLPFVLRETGRTEPRGQAQPDRTGF